MNGGREEGDAICKVCGEWYWFEVGVGGEIYWLRHRDASSHCTGDPKRTGHA